MSKKALGLCIAFLLLYFCLFNTVGSGIAILALAIGFLVQAVLFTIKPEYQDKWLKLMNPSLYNAYSKKGYDYIKKRNKINVIMYYILSIVMVLNGTMQLKNNRTQSMDRVNIREYFIFAIFIITMVILSNYICKFIIKKSKTANEELGWSILFGVVIAAIMIPIIVFYTLHKIIS